ncbi:Carbamoyl-phosphate synthase small chain [Austwickia sp. TVS 96-490-7B]|uniref:type 1 glutamine amidotransferase n=1 Tax=Austwickia sp. TVS 96-490-7B TaxID=2830843 RepID=UPI001C577357|nr:type 1 glutamine amidotransferase [Austwickia sp. TVS 96-490-7B]MBW3085908.1 Carbamoyl-phosphate synthase small chain [Austwickia sp. TVS 96-490-7B]
MAYRPVLVVQHEEDCPPGHFSTWAEEVDTPLDVRRCDLGEPLPDTLDHHSGMIVLGGPMGAYDDAAYPWLTATKALIIQAVIHPTPFLGICLGHQLAAAALGGRVARRAHPRRGIYTLGEPSGLQDDPIFGGLAPTSPLTFWHSDIVRHVPPTTSVVVHDAHGDPVLVRFAENAWGIQGHPEVDAEIVGRWGTNLVASPDDGPESLSPSDVASQVAHADEALVTTWRPVAHAFYRTTRLGPAHPGVRAVIPLAPPPQVSSGGAVPRR